jgi:hypothetical protein
VAASVRQLPARRQTAPVLPPPGPVETVMAPGLAVESEAGAHLPSPAAPDSVSPREIVAAEPELAFGPAVPASAMPLSAVPVVRETPLPYEARIVGSAPVTGRETSELVCGRDAGCPAPPAQIPARGITALGSCLRSEGTGADSDRDARCGHEAAMLQRVEACVARSRGLSGYGD